MADPEQVGLIKHSVEGWNAWRSANPDATPDFRGADLDGLSFDYADLRDADFTGATVRSASFNAANLQRANFTSTDAVGASFLRADLTGATIENGDFMQASLNEAKLCHATINGPNMALTDFSNADLTGATLKWVNFLYSAMVEATFRDAVIEQCYVYGVSVWNADLRGAKQSNIVITDPNAFGEDITVDNLEIAQFVHMLLNSEQIRGVIDALATRLVLILGRFSDEQKPALNALRDAVRARSYIPIVFDFRPPQTRDLSETVSTLAHLARFVIADLTDARSVPQELTTIIPSLPSVPVVPIVNAGADPPYALFGHFHAYPWVLPVYCYTDIVKLAEEIESSIIDPAEKMVTIIVQNRQRQAPR